MKRSGKNWKEQKWQFLSFYKRLSKSILWKKEWKRWKQIQVSEELFNRLKERVEKEKRQRRGRFTQKDYLIEIITQALDAADELEKQDEDEPELHVTQPEELELENEERLQEAESEEETE